MSIVTTLPMGVMASHEVSSLACTEKPLPTMDVQHSDQHAPSASASVDSKCSQRNKNLRQNWDQLRLKWNKFLEAWRTLVRTFSLGLLVHAFGNLRHPTGRGLHEPTKVAISHSRLLALLRNLVHLLPFGFALFEIVLNWNVYYVGTKPYSTAVYQIAAKAHEILIQASITTIIFSVIRRELALNEGLPFGFLFSGLQVSQISYLWSMELWGAMSAGSLRLWRRIGLLLLLTASILLAATCGPASAVLLIPRSQSWPAGRTHIWVNATTDQLWPTQIDGKSIPPECSVVGEEFSNVCPASEWYAIRDWLSTRTQSPPPPYLQRYRQVDALDSCLIHGVNSNRELKGGTYSGSALLGPPPIAATTPQAIIADALSSVGALWFLSLVNVTANAGHGVPLSDQSDATHRITGNYSQPYAVAACLPDQIRNATDQRKLAFPFIFFTNQPNSATRNQTIESPTYPGQVQVIEHPDYSFAQLQNTSGDDDGIRLQWIELPDNLFHGSSIGAAIILPQTEPGSAQNVVLCNLAAGWSSSSLELETSGRGIGTVQSTIQNKGQSHLPDRPISRTRVPTDEKNNPVLGDVFLGRGTPQQPISISEDWARYLNPTIKSLNTSLLDVLWQEQLEQGDEGSMRETAENILVYLTVNGLARTSWESRLQGELRTLGLNGNNGLDGNHWLQTKGDVFEVDPTKSRDWITLRVDSTLRGYGYNTLTVSPRIAIAILTTYCLLVVGHTLYSGITGISSNCWDTIAEVTALAINSTPTAALRNTCAGITELHIFKLPVRILVSKDEEGDGEHLELVFGQLNEITAEQRTIQANRTYGTLPRAYTGEHK